ncbi:MAG: 5-oxoprolinase subunit PxpB [Phycisphaerae bacterium]|jgi:KipI family sensor histidine kinase inhibitor
MIDADRDMRWNWASERHLRISLPAADAERAQARVRRALAALERGRPPGLVEITPAYGTLLLEFDLRTLDEERALAETRRVLSRADDVPDAAPRSVIEIPICYEPPCAPDAEDVARLHGLDVRDVARLHAEPGYVVHFIGFAPGFAYLGGLPKQLATPRLQTPRVRVPAGSVGIAGEQTGIYPRASPGGWRLIGRTPLVMFDARREKPSLLTVGDRVRFRPVHLTEFRELLAEPRGDE